MAFLLILIPDLESAEKKPVASSTRFMKQQAILLPTILPWFDQNLSLLSLNSLSLKKTFSGRVRTTNDTMVNKPGNGD